MIRSETERGRPLLAKSANCARFDRGGTKLPKCNASSTTSARQTA
jgi:hypothetical protein